MKYNYLLLLFLVGITSQAQLYVSNNTDVYVNNQFVYVTGKVALNAGASNLYLRNQSQLLQGNLVSGAAKLPGGENTGLGALSVYQEGTVNNFQYNYWCSPVGGSLAVAGNSPFSITQLGVPTTATGTTPATILALGNHDGVSGTGTLSIAPYWVWKYTTASTYAQWILVASAPILAAGEGFTMKGTSGSDATIPPSETTANKVSGAGQRYDFRGKPNDGTINVPVTNGTLTLTGNPYPSAIDMRIFLFRNPGPDLSFGTADDGPLENPLCDGTALYWEHDKTVNSHLLAAYKGGYGIYNGATGVYTPALFFAYDGAGTQLAGSTGAGTIKERRFAPIGQGFMLNGIGAGNVQFKNTHRVYRKEGLLTNSEFERTTATASEFYEDIPNIAGIDYTRMSKLPTPHIKINTLLNNQGIRQVDLAFMDSAIDGVDRADSRSPDAEEILPSDMYFALDNSEYVLSTTSFNINKKFAVGFKNSIEATFRVKVLEFVNFDGAQNVYLHDKITDLYHDIKNSEYEFSLPAGVNNNRFEVTFINNTLSTTNNVAADFDVFQNNGNQLLTIKNPKVINLKSCTLYDISGKTILSKTNLGSNSTYEYNTAGLSEGIYIVKLITEANQEISKKISILNKK
ncbi:T9SS type A sorting domain-containing protein [Flavobacterium psychrophilum]|nr:T9SS type A sorting domain-containing protein [Flavobacterium psychrophilum]